MYDEIEVGENEKFEIEFFCLFKSFELLRGELTATH